MRFVNGYRALIFRDKVTRAKWWESAVCSISGRVVGAMVACFAVFILYQLWMGGFRWSEICGLGCVMPTA